MNGHRIDTTDGIVTWKRYLTAGNSIPPHSRHLVSQVSDMVVFDYVINNPDRWSGGNTFQSREGDVLYFIDNTMSFGVKPVAHPRTWVYLQRVQKFSRSLVGRLRSLRKRDVREAVSGDLGPFPYALTRREIVALMTRRDRVLAYVDRLIARHGEQAVLAFP